MGYNLSTGIISQPVSIDDVQHMFGLSFSDLATLIINANVNIWSFIKPIYHTKVAQLTDTDRNGTGHVVSGYMTGAGIKKAYGTFSAFKNSLTSGNPSSAVWSYDTPLVDGSCVFRLTDFAGYYHFVARTFNVYRLFGNVDHIMIPSTSSGNGYNMAFVLNWPATTPDGGISLQHLFWDCKDSYFPAVILTYGNAKYGSYNCYFVRTTSDNLGTIIGRGDTSITITINTKDFARLITADTHLSSQTGPLANNANWTATMVLINTASPVTGDTHHIGDTINVVRLEYEEGVDRRTLPIKQSKWTNIE